MPAVIENDYLRYVIAENGENLHFIDKGTGADYCVRDPASPCAFVRKAGKEHPASAASYADGRLALRFGDSGLSAVLKAKSEKHYLVLEVVSVSGEGAEEFAFADIRLTLQGKPEEPFAACALALNLRTNVRELPQPNSRLRAMCYPRFGFAGAGVGLIGCPQGELRRVMQEVVGAAPELPHSPIGGPWALDAEINKGSYLFNFGELSEEKADEWIALAQSLGITQIDFHGGNSFRFGDCEPNPETYPHGFTSLKAVIDRLHDAGIAAGLHTYAFFIDKRCPWVTPVPDPRLAKDAVFTLAEPIAPDAESVPVAESTEGMSAVTGFFVRNSATLQIDDELITYTGVSKRQPYAFTGCTRGACGTKPARHGRGAKVHHLKECFGLFVPDPDTTLFEEVAQKAADAFNECGFDMTYLDALDGEDILGGAENAWHYGSKFVFEFFKRLKRPALFEMSTFHHHLWFVRSRIGAWDHPSRSYKRFIDVHCAANEQSRRMFLPAHLGWWAVKTWSGAQTEPTFPDDIEYLCCKALGTDTGFSMMGINPENADTPLLRRLGAIMKQYETLRHGQHFPESLKAKLREPGAEFALVRTPEKKWTFQPVRHDKHRVEGMDGWSNVWRTRNTFGRQPLQVRIEALLSAGPYDAPDSVVVADFSDPASFSERSAESGIVAELTSHAGIAGAQWVSGAYTARNDRTLRTSEATGVEFSPTEHGVRVPGKGEPAWTKVGKTFSPPLDLSAHQALGVWVHGDGQGEVLNFQLMCPRHIVAGIGEHYVIVDFTGWRYFELIEPEGHRVDEYSWPYSNHIYAIYRELVDYGHVESLSLWYNNLTPGKAVTCYLSPIKALPLVKTKLRNPALIIGGKKVTFPTEIESGCYLEFRSMSECALYGRQGEVLAEIAPQGEVPGLEEGEDEVRFVCEAEPDVSARAYVSLISRGEPIR